MRVVFLFFVLFFCTLSGQKILPFDSIRIKDAKDMLADDYGSIYIYKSKDFSFTKYDSLGKQMGKMMFTVPFRVQSVQNPLSIAFFSENAQEMKFVDQNLIDIQKIDFKQKFSYIKHAYAEDLQQIWLLDGSAKRLIQYNFRNDTTINSYSFDDTFDDLIDLLVYENKVYILTKNTLKIYTLKFEKIIELPVSDGKRFRRENEIILIVTKNSILKYIPEKELITVFGDSDAQIVDKNSLAYFEIKDYKLYLYNSENIKDFKKLKDLQNQKDAVEKSVEELEKQKSENGDVLKVMQQIQELGF